ncbi:MAG TPA: hypothetical protein VEJ86_05785 [Candidatus Binataceae bacterium]|nr:hypothetical protein [Candidatus Binataceae bacterium]
MADNKFDRNAEDLGNIVGLEHVNVTVPDQQQATHFYLTGLGLTRDPYLMTGTGNMWVNVGRSQLHLPTAKPQVLRGHIGMVLPDRAGLVRRLERLRKHLAGTCFDFAERKDFVDATCPWGNHFRCYESNGRFGRMTLGIPYVDLEVEAGTADGIGRFYREIMGTKVRVECDPRGRHAHVSVGNGQELVFRESYRMLPPYDGHHIQIYVGNFSSPYQRLLERGLISEESDQHQYRFKDIVDPDTGKVLYTLEHEVRSLKHPLYGRHLVNRNPAQSLMGYAPGQDVWQG